MSLMGLDRLGSTQDPVTVMQADRSDSKLSNQVSFHITRGGGAAAAAAAVAAAAAEGAALLSVPL